MAALLHQQNRPNYDYGVSDLSAGVRTTFIYFMNKQRLYTFVNIISHVFMSVTVNTVGDLIFLNKQKVLSQQTINNYY